MITLNAFKHSGRAPTVRAAKIGGIYRQDSGLIRVTLITDSAVAGVHLLWEPWEWVDINSQLDFTLDAFKKGIFAGGRMH